MKNKGMKYTGKPYGLKGMLVTLFFVIGLILSTIGYSFYRHESAGTKKEKYNELKAIADLKSSQIVSWRQERMNDALMNSASPILQAAIYQLKTTSDDPVLLEKVRSHLKLLRNFEKYENVILASPDGHILASLDPRLTALSARTKNLIALAAASREAVFGDLFRCPECGDGIRLDVASPIVNRGNRPLAVLILRIDPHAFLYPLLQSWPLPSKSAETLLIRRDRNDILYLNPLRHLLKPPLSVRIPVSELDHPVALAVMGKSGEFEGRDYRGVTVLEDIRPVPGSPWYMVAKVDKDEIFAGVHQQAVFIGLLTLALVLFAGALISFFYKNQGKRTFQALYQAERDRAEAQEEFRTTLYSIGDAVVTTDVDGYIRHLNPVAEELTGWKESEAKGKPVEEVFKMIDETTRQSVGNPVRLVLRKGLMVGLTNHTLLIKEDGSEIPISDSGAPILDEQGNTIGVVLVFRDQTAEREIENLVLARLKLLEYATNHSLGELLRKTIDEICAMTQSPIGFYHFVNEDQKTLSLQEWSTRTIKEFCKAEGKGLHYGMERAGVWADSVHTRKPVIHNDYDSLPNRKGMPEGHAAVKRELVVPIMRADRIVSILGVGNKPVNYTGKDVEIVSYLADIASDIIEKKRAEEKLQKNEKRFRSLFENMLNGFAYCKMVFDDNGKPSDFIYLDVNAAFEKLTGLKNVKGKKVSEVIPNIREIDPELFEIYGRVSSTGRPERFEMKVESLDAWFSASVYSPEKNHFVAVFDVVTERKRSEARLRESEERFRLLYEQSPVAYQSLDIGGNILEVNTAWLEELGYNREEVIGKWFGEFLAGDVQELFHRRFENLKATGEAHGVEFDMRRGDGSIISVSLEGRISHTVDGSMARTHCVFVNNTERKQREATLQKLTSRQEALLSAIPDIIMEVDVNRVYTWANPAGIAFFGDDVIGKETRYYFEGEQNTYEVVQPMIRGGKEAIYVESWQRRKDGKKRLLAWWCRALKDENGKVTGGLSSARDITDQKTLEAQFLQAQKMESIGQLAGGVAHDFNNMLGVIMGYAETALLQVDPTQPLHKDLMQIQKAAQRSAALTRQLLAFARRQAAQPVILDLNDTISGMLKMLRRLIGEDIDLAWKPGPSLWMVMMDPVQVDQIIFNILVNAKDAIAGVGNVTIETSNIVLDEAYCEAHAGFIPGRFVMMAISDSGTGMDKQVLEHIFEPFYTTKGLGKGTGLGLATVYGIVKQNDGFVNVYSEPEKGTTFKIYLPMAEDVLEIPTEVGPRKHLEGTETVLLVEDEEAILNLGTSILQRYGYRVLPARTPVEALSLAEKYHGAIHLLLTDVIMPEMNGRELNEIMARQYPGIKCLYMSGYTADAIAHHGVLDEFVHFLEKPFSVKALAEKVRDVLDSDNA